MDYNKWLLSLKDTTLRRVYTYSYRTIARADTAAIVLMVDGFAKVPAGELLIFSPSIHDKVSNWVNYGFEFMEINIAETNQDISECFEVLSQLRPKLEKESFTALIQELMLNHGYKLVYLKHSEVKSVMGIRIGYWLHTGKYLEIEDFVTTSDERSKGYGVRLLNWAKEYAKANQCNQVRLVSGVTREKAHKFYQNNGMSFEAKYYSFNL